MRDRVQPGVKLGSELQLDIVELRKADKLGIAPEPLKAWITFIEHWQEATAMANVDYEPVKKAMNKLKTLSADEEARRLAFVRERAVRDEASLMKQARNEGVEQGVQQGQSGMLARQLNRRFGPISRETQQRVQAASQADLERWAERILEAGTLEEVFQDH